MADSRTEWDEQDSQRFIDYGAYYVPEREVQIDLMCRLVPPGADGALHLVELCCGEGLLSAALLDRFPDAQLHAFDGSDAMLAATRKRTAEHGERLETQRFDLAATDWRDLPYRPQAVLSSLAVHHLDDAGKRTLFTDIAGMLAPGGAFILADLFEPTTAEASAVSADHWDDAVRERAKAIDGDLKAFEQFRSDGWNYYRDPDGDPVDQPASVADQLRWMAVAGLERADIHWMRAGHAVLSARKAK